jgi:hypothetical protein
MGSDDEHSRKSGAGEVEHLGEEPALVAASAATPRIATHVVPHDFFREVVCTAIEDRGVEATRDSEAYLISLLADHAYRPNALGELSQPFGVRFVQALHSSGGERFARLRSLGDDVLFLSGFFSDHLASRGVEPHYAAGLGQAAYGGVASMLRRHSEQAPPVFDELADNFSEFVALLQHVADVLVARSLHDHASLLDLYERWSRTGSSALAEALIRLGVAPTRGNPSLN